SPYPTKVHPTCGIRRPMPAIIIRVSGVRVPPPALERPREIGVFLAYDPADGRSFVPRARFPPRGCARSSVVREVPAAGWPPATTADRARVEITRPTAGGLFHEAHGGGLAVRRAQEGAPRDARGHGEDRRDVRRRGRCIPQLARARSRAQAVDD